MINQLKERYYRRKGQKLLAQRDAAKAQKFLLKCVELNPSAENMFNLALSYMALFHYQEAEKYLRRIYDIHPDNEINILALIESLLLQRKWSRLEEIISEKENTFSDSSAFSKYTSLALDPVEREKYVAAKEKYNLGFQEIEKGNKEAALQHLLFALDYFDASAELLQNIGVLYFERSNYTEAFKFFEKALANSPGNLQLQQLLIKTKKQLQKN